MPHGYRVFTPGRSYYNGGQGISYDYWRMVCAQKNEDSGLFQSFWENRFFYNERSDRALLLPQVMVRFARHELVALDIFIYFSVALSVLAMVQYGIINIIRPQRDKKRQN